MDLLIFLEKNCNNDRADDRYAGECSGISRYRQDNQK